MAVTVPYIQRCKSEHILYPKAKSEQEMFACGCSLYYKAFQDYSYTFRIEALLFASKCFHSLLLFEVSHSYLVSPVHPGSWNAQAQNVLHFWWYTCLKIHFFFSCWWTDIWCKILLLLLLFSPCKSLVFYVMFPRDYSYSIKKKRKCRTSIPWSPLPSLFSTINVRHLSFQGNDGREENFPFQKGKYFASFRRAAHQIF